MGTLSLTVTTIFERLNEAPMKTILVVDDTPSELELMTRFLKESGYSVIVATDAKEAMTKATDFKPDAVVTDVVMPGMSGFELCRTLKKNEATQNMPIVVCTSKNQDLDRLWGMKQGADVYVTKPFTQDELVKAVNSVVG
jgi:two-component system, chemotaxis family, response regulator PixH